MKRGDVQPLGLHRLMCGNSGNEADVAKLFGEQKPDLVVTSPPYASQREYGGHMDNWLFLMRRVFGCMPTKPTTQVLVNLGLIHVDGEVSVYWEPWVAFMRSRGWKFYGWYVWDKISGMPGGLGGRPASCHEFIFHFNKQAVEIQKTQPCKHAGKSSFRANPRAMASSGGASKTSKFASPDSVTGQTKIPDSVFRMHAARTSGQPEAEHPAVYPIGLPLALYKAYAKPGDVVYEPFSGSGTSLMAAEECGMRCFAMDIEPTYCDIALRRYGKMLAAKSQEAI